MKLLLFLVLLAGCHDSCSPNAAARAGVGPNAVCVANDHFAWCINNDNTVHACKLVGDFTFDAKCELLGTFTRISK